MAGVGHRCRSRFLHCNEENTGDKESKELKADWKGKSIVTEIIQNYFRYETEKTIRFNVLHEL